MVSIKDKDIQRVIDLLKKNAISELEVQDGKQVIRVRASLPHQTTETVPVHTSPTPVSEKPRGNKSSHPAKRSEETSINAPCVGTVYLTPSPDEPAFVSVGQTIKKGQMVCLIEAMKTFNHIKSPIAGRLVEICVGNGEAVEFDKPIFVVATH